MKRRSPTVLVTLLSLSGYALGTTGGCTGGSAVVEPPHRPAGSGASADSDPTGSDTGVETIPSETATEDDGDGDDGDGDDGDGDDADGCADIYADDILPTFEIEISEEAWAALEADFADPGACGGGDDPKRWHPIESFSWGEETFEGGSIRLKGNECFSWIPPKMQFVVSFTEDDPDGRFHGLRKVNFDAPWYDGSLLHERLAASFLRDAGLPGICANNSRLVVNGAYYGAYANTENPDQEFLERVYGKESAAGTLYKYGTTATTNEDAANSDRLARFWADRNPETLALIGDLDEWLTEWAAEVVMPDGDGYQCCNHNFLLYDHPSRGFLFVPYDLDYTFDGGDLYTPISAEANPFFSTWGNPAHFAAFTAIPEWRGRYIEAVRTVRGHYDEAVLLERVARWSAQIEAAVEEDPSRTFSMEDHERAVGLLEAFIPTRGAWLDGWLAENP